MCPGLVQARLESAGGAECGATAVEMVLPCLPELNPDQSAISSSSESSDTIGRCKYNNATANGVIRPPEQHSSDKWIMQGCVRAAETHADHAK